MQIRMIFKRLYCKKLFTGFELVYKFPYIVIGAAVNKLKVKYSVLTGVSLPLCAALEFHSMVPSNYTLNFLIFGCASNAALFLMGQGFYRMIGNVYYNQESDTVRISYLGFLGQRINLDVPRSSINTTWERSGMFYSPLEVKENANSSLILKFQEKYYDVSDMELARKALGQGFGRHLR